MTAVSFPSSLIVLLVNIPDAVLPPAGLLWSGIPPLACLTCEDTFPDVLGVVLVDWLVIVLVTGSVVAGGRDVADKIFATRDPSVTASFESGG